MNNQLHTFVVCAYKESPYLSECLESLQSQSIPSDIIIATSTPCQYISNIAKKFAIPVFVNDNGGTICKDWNFAATLVQTPYFTIAHQDDVYLRDYCKNVINAFSNETKPLIFFSNYAELRNGISIDNGLNLAIKRWLLTPLTKTNNNTEQSKREILRLGNPICCPSVAYVKDNLPYPLFHEGFRSNLDWDAWERFSTMSGAFCYEPEILMKHRVHEESETSHVINDNARKEEDYEILRRFWPNTIAKLIATIYQFSERSNQLRN